MIQILISALLVLVLVGIFAWCFNRVLKHNPTKVKTSFGTWFSIEAEFKDPASETRT